MIVVGSSFFFFHYTLHEERERERNFERTTVFYSKPSVTYKRQTCIQCLGHEMSLRDVSVCGWWSRKERDSGTIILPPSLCLRQNTKYMSSVVTDTGYNQSNWQRQRLKLMWSTVSFVFPTFAWLFPSLSFFRLVQQVVEGEEEKEEEEETRKLISSPSC